LLHPAAKISILYTVFHHGTLNLYGPLAQLVEQLTLNQRVEGSTPSRLTIK
jgi:hypothetical protein